MPSLQPSNPAVRGCLDACDRCERVIDAITPEMYSGALPGRYAVGSHLRHTIEHFQCFFAGITGGVVDYDARARDEDLEHRVDRFREVLDLMRDKLIQLDRESLSRPLRVRQIASLDSDPSEFDSTVARELAFLSSHTVHHLALVVHLCRELGVDLPEEISLAFSTAAHRQATAG
jgi:uncharacterized damage-inducible protein DinB